MPAYWTVRPLAASFMKSNCNILAEAQTSDAHATMWNRAAIKISAEQAFQPAQWGIGNQDFIKPNPDSLIAMPRGVSPMHKMNIRVGVHTVPSITWIANT